MRTVLVLCFLMGCTAPAPEPSRSPGPPTPRPTVATDSAGPGLSPSPPSAATALPADLEPVAGPLARYTIVCEDWGSEGPATEVGCEIAARLALAAIGNGRAAAVRRLDVAYGDPCEPGASCGARVAEVRSVVARSADFETIVVRVARDPDGQLQVWPPVEGRRIVPGSFEPPPAAAPRVDENPPAELRTRQPLPFCGSENLTQPDAFDSAARRCFVDAVQAWRPAELILTDRTTDDGVPVTTVLRFTGRGSIERYVRSDGQWAAVDCALSPIGTIAAFVIVPPCSPHALHP